MGGAGNRLREIAWGKGVVARSSLVGRGVALVLGGGWLGLLTHSLSRYGQGASVGGVDFNVLVDWIKAPPSPSPTLCLSWLRGIGFQLVIGPVCIILGGLVLAAALQVARCFTWQGRSRGKQRQGSEGVGRLVDSLSYQVKGASKTVCRMVNLATVLLVAGVLAEGVWEVSWVMGGGAWGRGDWVVWLWQSLNRCSLLMMGVGCLWLAGGIWELINWRNRFRETELAANLLLRREGKARGRLKGRRGARGGGR